MEDIARYASKILVMNNAQVFCYEDTAEVFKKADEISKMGLSVPQITRVVNELRRKGINLKGDIFTVEAAKNSILQYLEEKGEVEC